MSEAEEVCVVAEQEREPEATCSGGPPTGRGAKAKKSRSSRSSRAGLLFPVSRIDRQLRRGRFAERLGARAPVFLAAVLQWVTHKTMDMAGKMSKRSNQHRISPGHLQMAVRNSSALKQLLLGKPRHHSRAVPQSQRVAAPSRKRKAKDRRRRRRQRAAPARATAAVAAK